MRVQIIRQEGPPQVFPGFCWNGKLDPWLTCLISLADGCPDTSLAFSHILRSWALGLPHRNLRGGHSTACNSWNILCLCWNFLLISVHLTGVTSLIKVKFLQPEMKMSKSESLGWRRRKQAKRRKGEEIRARPMGQKPPPCPPRPPPVFHPTHVPTGPHRPPGRSRCPPGPSPSLGNHMWLTLSRSISSSAPFLTEHPASASWQVSFCWLCGNYTSASSKYYLQLSNFFPPPQSCQTKVGGEPFSPSGSMNSPFLHPRFWRFHCCCQLNPSAGQHLGGKRLWKEKQAVISFSTGAGAWDRVGTQIMCALWTESVPCFPASALVTQQQPSHLLPSPPSARLLLPSHVLTLQLEVFLNMISEK